MSDKTSAFALYPEQVMSTTLDKPEQTLDKPVEQTSLHTEDVNIVENGEDCLEPCGAGDFFNFNKLKKKIRLYYYSKEEYFN